MTFSITFYLYSYPTERVTDVGYGRTVSTVWALALHLLKTLKFRIDQDIIETVLFFFERGQRCALVLQLVTRAFQPNHPTVSLRYVQLGALLQRTCLSAFNLARQLPCGLPAAGRV